MKSYTKSNAAKNSQVAGEHYIKLNVQPWDVIDTWPKDQQIGYHRGNVVKYMMRFGSKDAPLQELKKAQHYLNKLIELLERS